MNKHHLLLQLPLMVCCVIGQFFATPMLAQSPYEQHYLIRGDMPPGLAADSYRLAHPELNYAIQPVRLVVPNEARVETGSNGAYSQSFSSRLTVGMSIGPVYRFKVTNIPQHSEKEVYPSVEILNKLNPPPGLENKFPIQINITQDDLEQAMEGRMVTKVIYLENSEIALPHRQTEDNQPYFDVGGGEDPLRAAERLGRPMAILRIGSRVPTNTKDDEGFAFYSPSPVILSDSLQAEMEIDSQADHNWDQLEGIDAKSMPQRHVPSSVPEKIPGKFQSEKPLN